MIVTCAGCETNFRVDDRLIKPSGSRVRCSKCRHVFTAYSPAALAEPEEPLILSEELPAAAAFTERAEPPETASRIDALFGPGGIASDGVSAVQEPELLDVDELLSEDEPPAAVSPGETLGDDLQLDLDLGLNLDEDAAGEGPAAEVSADVGAAAPDIDFNLDLESPVEAAAEESLPSLDELGINLEDLDAPETAAGPEAAAGSEAVENAGLELDLDLPALESDSLQDQPSEPAEAKLEDDLVDAAAELPADSAAPEATEAEPPLAESELDLSDLEKMLEGDLQELEGKTLGVDEDLAHEMEAVAAAPEGDEKARELEELDLVPIAGEALAEADAAGMAEEPKLEFDLTPDIPDGLDAVSAPASAPAPQDDVLDFSDITSILEETPPPDAHEAVGPIAELDLLAEEAQPPASPATPTLPAEATDDLMLDIETLLEDGAKTDVSAEQPPAETTEAFDLDLVAEPAQSAAGDLEIEIEPVDEGLEPNAVEGRAAAEAALAGASAAATDRIAAEQVTGTDAREATQVIEPEPAIAAAAAALAAAATPRRTGISKPLVAVLGVLLLVVAALVVPRSLGIRIPFLSDLEIPLLGKIFDSQPEDPAGNLKMAPLAENLSAEFVDNPAAGRLCVVKGQVRNNYDHSRSAIRVTAKLYTKDKSLAKTATVYAGNVLSNQELSTQEMAAIAGRLKNKDGANKTNVSVKPGQTIPFMAVFDNLPANLDEYSVEVAGSTK
jgi:predicted Zn finger-like uncharacterized protein